MVLEIRRYHILIVFCLASVYAGAAIFSKETGQTLKTAGAVQKVNLPALADALTPPPLAGKLSQREREAAPAPAVPAQKRIALTFDDGPHPGQTERLLEILKKNHVRATFFVVGKQVELYPELLKLIASEGHEIANHTYSHTDMRALSPSEIAEELNKTQRLVIALTGRRMRYFRPPGGRYNSAVIKTAGELGYEMALWSIFSGDHAHPPGWLIRSRVLSRARGESVVLFHSGVENTLETLPSLIATLKDRGYKFETVSTLKADRFTALAKK